MTMMDWARREVEIACKKENPNWDGESFDYGCACYLSALKAYESLMSDDHSGYSFSVTRNILTRLLDGNPLTPITDEDFFSVQRGTEEFPLESPEYLKDAGLKSSLQCPRMSSLFREETLDGIVKYHDNDRAYCINVEDERDTFHCWLTKIIDEMFPITMPYIPTHRKYKVYVYTFLCDKSNGDFDHHGIQKIVTPKGKEIEVNDWYFRVGENDKWVKVSKEQFFEDKKHRIDKTDER